MKRFVPLVLVLALLPLAASAQGRNQYLEEARRRLARHQPDKAVDELRRALTLPGLPVAQEVEILGLLGACLEMSGRPAEAVQPWEERARLAPDAPLPEGLPEEVAEAYRAVRDATVVVEHLPPPAAFAGRPLDLRANLVDRKHRARDLLVYHRRKGERDWAVTPFAREADGWVAHLHPPPVAGSADEYDLQYYIVAQAESGEVLHAAGSAKAPLEVQVLAAPPDVAPPPGHEVIAAVDVRDTPPPAAASDEVGRDGAAPWLWVGLGLVAAGLLGGGAYLALGQGGDLPPTSLGVVHYPLERGRR